MECENSTPIETFTANPSNNIPTGAPNGTFSEIGNVLTNALDCHEAASHAPIPCPPRRTVRGIRWLLLVTSLFSTIVLYGLDNTIVANITPAIINRLGNAEKSPWISVGFFLGGSSTIFISGKLYTLFDAKHLFLSSMSVFLIGSAICGAAPNMDVEIVGRVLAGMGGNSMYIGVMTILTVNTTDAERPRFLGLDGAIWGVATILGPVVGGALELYNWRFAFYINLFIAAALTPIFLLLIPRYDPRPGVFLKRKLQDLDHLGNSLSLGAFVVLLMPIDFGGSLYSWASGTMITLYVVTVVSWTALFIQQRLTIFTTRQLRTIPLHLIVQRETFLISLGYASTIGTLFIPVYYIPLYLQFTLAITPIQTSLCLLPLLISYVLTILIYSHFLTRLPNYKLAFILGPLLALPGMICLSTSLLTSPAISPTSQATSTLRHIPAVIYPASILIGIGSALVGANPYAVVLGILPERDRHDATTLLTVAQIGGATVALGIAGVVFVSLGVSGLAETLPGLERGQIIRLLTGISGGTGWESLGVQERGKVVALIVCVLRKVFIVGYAGEVLALICGTLLKHQAVRVGQD